MERLEIYTDGGVIGNGSANAVGTYAFLLKPEIEKIYELLIVHAAKYVGTTNNRMEMTAAIKAIKFCMEHPEYTGKPMRIVSDSSYLVDGVTKPTYLDRWLQNGWKTTSKNPVKNIDLWSIINRLRWSNSILWTHIRGHGKCSDITHRQYNDICDAACRYCYNLQGDMEYTLAYSMRSKSFTVLRQNKALKEGDNE